MKKVILGLIMLTVIAILPCHGQPSEKALDQIKKIMADAPNCFKRLTNTVLSSSEYDTLYQSRVTVDGTTNNVISVGNTVVTFNFGSCLYKMHLKEGLNEADAIAFIENWKKPLATLLGTKYKMSVSTEAGPKDYKFTNQETNETISLMYREKGVKLFEVALSIFKSIE